jgi:hypothetical protein
MRSLFAFLVVLTLGASCRRPTLVPLSPPGPVPSALDRPAGGWVCTRQVATQVAPAVLFHEARLAVAKLRLTPALLDSTRSRVTIAGDLAPPGRGTPAQQAMRLYLNWQVVPPPDSTGGSLIYLAPGLSTRVTGLSREEHRELALQAGALAGRFIRAIPSAPDFGFICNAAESEH